MSINSKGCLLLNQTSFGSESRTKLIKMSEKCANCAKRVYAAEWVIACEKYWHKLCLVCNHCKKMVSLGGFSEHDGMPYCKPDYDKLFRIKGFGFGGAADSVAASEATPTTPSETTEVPIVVASGSRSRSGSASIPAGEPEKIVLHSSGCPKCGKKVYFNEKIAFDGKEWHKQCFTCSNCNKSLSGGQYGEHNGLPYCMRCHNSRFGTKGFGYGGAAVMH